MPSHNPHDEEDSYSAPPDWEWIGSDGLTDSERAVYAERFSIEQGRPFTPAEINALRSLSAADMLTKVKLEELPA
jgi:hypothetical protein